LRLALIAPPAQTVPPSSLGGLEQVRWLAEGLAGNGHHVTLIGTDLAGLPPGHYAVANTDLAKGGRRATPELIDQLHAERAGEILDQLRVDAVSDHTRAGYRPASGHPQLMAHTLYQPIASSWLSPPARPPLAHLAGGYVAVSTYQQRSGLGLPWLAVIHPGIPFAEHPLSLDHDGLCVYLGPLQAGHGARAALEAAHQAGRPIVLAGTRPSGEATAYAQIELRPLLGAGDRLLERVSASERAELLGDAHCLLGLLHYGEPSSLEVVEAMAYGTPVVTMAGTVGGELVTHGVSGLVLTDLALLADAIERSGRLDPKEIREHAAAQFDVAVMVAAYEELFGRLLRPGGR